MFACRKIDRLLVTYTTCGRSKKKSPRFKNSLWTVIIRVLKLQWKHLLQHLLTTTICNAQFKNILVLNIFDLTWNTQRAGKPVGSFDIKFLLSAFFNRLLNYDAVLFLVPTYFSSQGSILKAVRLFFSPPVLFNNVQNSNSAESPESVGLCSFKYQQRMHLEYRRKYSFSHIGLIPGRYGF